MAQVAFPITNFQTSNGSPLSGGYIELRLSQDGNSGAANICNMIFTISLDINGNVLGSPMIWPNTGITPTGTYYIISSYSQQGELVSGPDVLTIS